MARKTPLQKLNETAANLEKVQAELSTFSAILKLPQLVDCPEAVQKMKNYETRCIEDVEYLSNRIRGIIVREASISKLVENAKLLLS
jgi:hypothetical protein